MTPPKLSTEAWLWKQVLEGQRADFDALFGKCDSKSRSGWELGRQLDPRFLREIFSNAKYKDAIPTQGVWIVGAWFLEEVDLRGVRIDCDLLLKRSRFDRGINLSYQTVHGNLSLQSSSIENNQGYIPAADLEGTSISQRLILDDAAIGGRLSMHSLEVGKDLLMRRCARGLAKSIEVELSNARIGGNFYLEEANIDGPLRMRQISVSQSIYMSGGRFAQTDLSNAKIDRCLSLEGVTVDGHLEMHGLHVGQDVFMGSTTEVPARFSTINLCHANVERQCSLSGAEVAGRLDMRSTAVVGDLIIGGIDEGQATTQLKEGALLERAMIGGGVSLDRVVLGQALYAPSASIGTDLFVRELASTSNNGGVFVILRQLKVGRNIDFTDMICEHADLSASHVSGELRLFPERWINGGKLVLRNAHISVLHDSASMWPACVEQAGFTYDRWGGVGELDAEHNEMRDRPGEWYIQWLEKDPSYTPQPYEQLAHVFRRAGAPDMAADVLYAGRERARRSARVSWRRSPSGMKSAALWSYIGLTLLKWTIGYGLGLRYFRCLWWVLGFTIIGIAVLKFDASIVREPVALAPEKEVADLGSSLAFSLQKLLPFVEFNEFKDIQLGPIGRWYFYFQQLAGYVLAAFLGAGLAGLTQKP